MKPDEIARYDYDLPESAIALHPAAERDDSRLLHLARGNGIRGHHRFRDLPELLRPGDLLVLNETFAFPARLWARKVETGGRVEILLLRPEKPGTWEVLWRPHRRVHVGARAEILGRGEGSAASGSTDANAGVAGSTDANTGALAGAARPAAGLNPRGADAREGSGLFVEVVGIAPSGHLLARFEGLPASELTRALDQLGEPPLPPYIKRGAIPEDRERYQTVYARVRGSVAAPTAGMHFTPRLLESLVARGVATAKVVLHVGLATFQPVTAQELETGELGEEYFEVPVETARLVNEARAAGRRVVAVGTTVVRTLESALDRGSSAASSAVPGASGGPPPRVRLEPGRGWTRKFIAPPYTFRAVDAMITNFHLPRSTLILLTAAFAGREPLLAAYAEALRLGYRFASYGDAMLIE